MRVAATVLAAAAFTVSMSPPAVADQAPALNGVYTAVSDGTQAKTNDVYRGEGVVVSTWTVTSTCTAVECTGQVHSDAGWTADAHMLNGRWAVVRDVSDWERCPDGTSAPGRQKYSFTAVELAGFDVTLGPSGGCNLNAALKIQMPFTLTRAAPAT